MSAILSRPQCVKQFLGDCVHVQVGRFIHGTSLEKQIRKTNTKSLCLNFIEMITAKCFISWLPCYGMCEMSSVPVTGELIATKCLPVRCEASVKLVSETAPEMVVIIHLYQGGSNLVYFCKHAGNLWHSVSSYMFMSYTNSRLFIFIQIMTVNTAIYHTSSHSSNQKWVDLIKGKIW